MDFEALVTWRIDEIQKEFDAILAVTARTAERINISNEIIMAREARASELLTEQAGLKRSIRQDVERRRELAEFAFKAMIVHEHYGGDDGTAAKAYRHAERMIEVDRLPEKARLQAIHDKADGDD